MIKADQLTRRYGDMVAVDSVSFAIEPGEIVGLLGHNGAGKTTIMKMLTGYLEPSSGTVEVDGVDVSEHPAQVQRRVGYLPESVPLYPEMTVVDYLDFAATVRGVPDAERKDAVRDALQSTNLAPRAFDTIATLSRGYRQRVGVAQAILHRPEFLILDEPTNGLDPSQTLEMRGLIHELAKNATIILSTHIMQEVDAVCDRVMIIRNGQLVVDERLRALQQTDRLYLDTDAAGADVQAAVDGVARVVSTDFDRAIYLTLDGPVTDEITSKVARLLVGAGVPIHALYPQKRDLESVFREVNEFGAEAFTGEVPAEQREAAHVE